MSEVDVSAEQNGVMDEIKLKPEEVITPDIVEKIAKGANPDWEVEGYTAKLGTQLGDNFMSIMYSVGIDVKSSKDATKKNRVEAMVKTMPKNAARVAMINDAQAFVKEIKMYEVILPQLKEFQKSKGIGEEEIFTPWPQLFAAHTTESGIDDFVALQDLRPLKYGMACRREGLGLEDSKFVLRALGKYHAISYAQFQGDFDRLLSAYPYLKEKLFKEDTPDVTKQWLRETFTREAQMVRDKDPKNAKAADDLESLFSDEFWGQMFRLTSCWTKVAVIGHSDCWTNNFLFKYETDPVNKGQPKAVDLKFVDFQLCRVGSRCLDLGYFMYTSPRIQVLNEHEKELLAEYYEAFKGFATKLGYFDPELTFEQLLEEYEAYRLHGIVIGCMLAPILTAKSGDIPDLETMPEGEDEMMSEESKEMWFGNMGKEQLTYDKVFNIAQNHLPKILK